MNTFASGTKTHSTTQPDTETTVRRIPPYHVILLNDDHHSFEFVIGVVRKVIGCSLEKAFQLTLEAHNTGRAIIWTGSKEVAELKVEQISTYHERRSIDGKDLGPLGVRIEPAPSA